MEGFILHQLTPSLLILGPTCLVACITTIKILSLPPNFLEISVHTSETLRKFPFWDWERFQVEKRCGRGGGEVIKLLFYESFDFLLPFRSGTGG